MHQYNQRDEAAVDVLIHTVRRILTTKRPLPVLCTWIISAEMAKTIQVATIEQLTTNPSLIVELDYSAEDWLVVLIMAARCDQAQIEDIIKQVAEFVHMDVTILL
jgi:hypothetical protein